MVPEKTPSKAALAVLQKLDELLEGKKWEGSIFLQVIKKKIEKMRSEYAAEIGAEAETVEVIDQLADTPLPEGIVEVYISLYLIEGSNLKKWEALLSNIGRQSVNRPIYGIEQDVQDLMRSKDYHQNDAYAVVRIRKTDIYQPYNKPPVDKTGREILVVRDAAVKAESVVRFIHTTGRYRLIEGKLVKY